MADKKSFAKRKEASTCLAYVVITWATILGMQYAFVEKENREHLSAVAELSQNKEASMAMRRLYAVAVAEKMQRIPEIGPLTAIDAVRKDLTKRFSAKNNADALSAVRAANVIQKELSTLGMHTTRWEFSQILMVYPYVDDPQFLWDKSKPEDVKRRIDKYHSFVDQVILKGLEQTR